MVSGGSHARLRLPEVIESLETFWCRHEYIPCFPTFVVIRNIYFHISSILHLPYPPSSIFHLPSYLSSRSHIPFVFTFHLVRTFPLCLPFISFAHSLCVYLSSHSHIPCVYLSHHSHLFLGDVISFLAFSSHLIHTFGLFTFYLIFSHLCNVNHTKIWARAYLSTLLVPSWNWREVGII